jgi:hypothetical protein
MSTEEAKRYNSLHTQCSIGVTFWSNAKGLLEYRKNVNSPNLDYKFRDSPGFFKNNRPVSRIPPLSGNDLWQAIEESETKEEKSSRSEREHSVGMMEIFSRAEPSVLWAVSFRDMRCIGRTLIIQIKS